MTSDMRRAAGFAESRLFPLLFAYFAVEQAVVIWTGRAGLASLRAEIDINALTTLALLIVRLLLIVFNAASVYFLVRSRQGERWHVQRPRDVLVPLLSTFFILATNVLAYIPAPTNFRTLPDEWTGELMIIGLSLALAGSALSLYGVIQLGDSFAIFIQRRKLVTGGPYGLLRHPIYVGHSVRMIGYWLLTSYTHHLLFTAVGIALLIYRGRLEDERLAEGGGAEYRRYRVSTENNSLRLAAGALAFMGVLIWASAEIDDRLDEARLSRVEGTYSAVDGPGIPVVFVHGAGGSRRVWDEQLSYLRDRNRAVSIDLLRRIYVGVQENDRSALADTVRDIETVTTVLGVRRFVLVGHSLGAHAAIEFADRHPERVAGLMLVDPTGDYRWLPGRLKNMWLSRFEDHKRRMSIWSLLLRNSKPHTREVVLADLESTPEPTFRALGDAMFSYDPATPYRRFAGPKLSVFSACVDGSNDGSNFVPLPRKCMPGVSHWMMMDDPAKLNRILSDFLAALPRGTVPEGGTLF